MHGTEYHRSVVTVGAMIKAELFAGALLTRYWLARSRRSSPTTSRGFLSGEPRHPPDNCTFQGTARPLSEAKRTSLFALQASAFDPKQTLALPMRLLAAVADLTI